MIGNRKSLENPFYLISSSIIFSSAWMAMSFTFPIIGTSYNIGYIFTGTLGTIAIVPFIIVSYIYRNSSKRMINFGLKAPFLVLSILCFIISFNQGIYFLVPVVLVGGIIQSFFWVSTEIEINLLEKSGYAEIYSAAWGIPAGILPAITGFIIEFTGYRSLFIILGLLFIIGFYMQPTEHKERTKLNSKPIALIYIIPMLFVGILAGFVFFVLVPLLLHGGISIYIIGIIASIWGISFAGGSLALNLIKLTGIKRSSLITSIFVSFPIFWFFYFNIYSIIGVLVIGGVGVSIGFSKILSYISETSSPRDGVYYYESLFSIGFITGSLGGSLLFTYFSTFGIFIIFLIPLIYSFFLLTQMMIKKSEIAF
ncbi:MAG: MFS transporter [Thermoplasmataceae archaeon]